MTMRLLFFAAIVANSHGATTNHFFGQNGLQQLLGDPSPKCKNCLSECREGDQYPNIGQGFRGYNPVRGDPLATEGDPGYEAQIFDEESERDGLVRFGNTVGSDLNRCNGNVNADLIETTESFFSSITETEGSQSGFHVGPEMEVSGGFGKGGAEISASRNIPHLYQSMGSNSNVMRSTTSSMVSHERRVIRSRFNCYEYEFEIKDYIHPKLTDGFKQAVLTLDICLESLTDYNDAAGVHNECVKKFLSEFGTHYIKSARFGSTRSVITVMDKRAQTTADKNHLEECATENSQWSFLGFFGGGEISTKCKNSIFDKESSLNRVIVDEMIMTVGSRPAADYNEWAQQMGKPEIVHKNIAPITELLKQNFLLDDLLDSGRFDSDGYAKIKLILDNYIVNYCQLFPSDCTHVIKRPYCQSQKDKNKYENCECKPSESTCGLYTGHVNENFLPHGEGLMNIGGKDIRSEKWNNGVMEGEIAPQPPTFEIPQEECRWKSTYYYETVLRCDGNEIAVGRCSAGGERDCPQNTVHEIKCCAVPGFVATKCKLLNEFGYGENMDCRTSAKGNVFMEGACTSGANRDCHGQAAQAECCQGSLGLGADQLGVPDESTCKWNYTNVWGKRLQCSRNDEAVVGHCGSGANKDCISGNTHGILCCQIGVI